MNDNYEMPRNERPAVAAPPDLLARYETPDGGTFVTTPIYAFSVGGHPLVLDGATRLVRAEVLQGTKMTYVGVHTPYGPPLTGPFTPAPAGLVAVFSDEREQPVLFYDVHGRAVLMNLDDVTRDLVLAEELDNLVRVEFRPATADPQAMITAETPPVWTVELAETILRTALPTGSAFLRALIDEGGTATPQLLKERLATDALHPLRQTLTAATAKVFRARNLDRSYRHFVEARSDPDNPRKYGVHYYVLPDELVPIFDQALRNLGR